MLREMVRSLTVVTACLAATTSAAWAIPSPYSDSAVCGGDNFKTCASLSVVWTGFTATIHIRNVGEQGEVFTAFGFTNLPAGTTVLVTTMDSRLATRFVPGTANDIQAVGFVAVPPSTQTGLRLSDNTGAPFVFTISFSGLTTADIAALGFSIHAQSGPNGCSTKLIIAPNGVQNGLGGTPGFDCPVTVVPEPISVALLASGLAGMGGVAGLRRRPERGKDRGLAA